KIPAVRGGESRRPSGRRKLFSVRREDEAIAFAVLEHRVGAPRLFFRWSFKIHPALLELLVSLIDVLAGVRHRHEGADALFLALSRKKHDPRVRLWDAQLDPALLFIKRLIGDDREPEFLGVEIQRPI